MGLNLIEEVDNHLIDNPNRRIFEGEPLSMSMQVVIHFRIPSKLPHIELGFGPYWDGPRGKWLSRMGQSQ